MPALRRELHRLYVGENPIDYAGIWGPAIHPMHTNNNVVVGVLTPYNFQPQTVNKKYE